MTLTTYLNQIGKIPLLSDEEEKKYGTDIKYSSPESDAYKKARDKLITSNLRLVVSIAKKYANPDAALDDLIEYGNIGLITASERFDVDRGYKFSTYASWWVRQSITRHLPQEMQIRLPIYTFAGIHKISKFVAGFAGEHGRYPTRQEVCDLAQVSSKSYDTWQKYYLQKPLSLDAPVGDTDLKLNEIISDTVYPKPHHGTENSEIKKTLAEALGTLKPSYSDVLMRRFGINGFEVHTLKKIGDIYNITREAIRSTENKGKKLLRRKRVLKELFAAYCGRQSDKPAQAKLEQGYLEYGFTVREIK
jgi:RNA polymerase primary sigma factor